MSSKSFLPYAERAESHPNPVAERLFKIAETKKTNIVLSADLTTTEDLHLADRNIVQMQYHRGAFRISEWAHIVNACGLACDGIVEALTNAGTSNSFEYKGSRALLMLAEMTTKGSLATGSYTASCIESARKHKNFVIGFVTNQALTTVNMSSASEDEDFVVFTTGVNRATKGDTLGQQYQTPERAVAGGSDFIISGRGIYATADPVETVKLYREEGWNAYLAREGRAEKIE